MADSTFPLVVGGGVLLALLLRGRRAEPLDCPKGGCTLADTLGSAIPQALNDWRQRVVAYGHENGLPILDPFYDPSLPPGTLPHPVYTEEAYPPGSENFDRLFTAWLNAIAVFRVQGIVFQRAPLETLRNTSRDETSAMLLAQAARTSWGAVFEPF